MAGTSPRHQPRQRLLWVLRREHPRPLATAEVCRLAWVGRAKGARMLAQLAADGLIADRDGHGRWVALPPR